MSISGTPSLRSIRRFGDAIAQPLVWLLHFGAKQALCCVFAASIFLIMAVSKVVTVPFLHRYDLILLVCIAVQWLLLHFKWESRDELKVIMVFHLIGLGLELFKVHVGSWSYPEQAWSKFAGVPLYSGFMYSSVASYICQAWKRLELEVTAWPGAVLSWGLSFAIYANFFTHHVFYDLRWVIIGCLFWVFRRSTVSYTVNGRRYAMPMLLGFFLVALFVWLTENISTFLGAWAYPDQTVSWSIVHWGKITSWFLLVIISMVIVAQLKRIKYPRRQTQPPLL